MEIFFVGLQLRLQDFFEDLRPSDLEPLGILQGEALGSRAELVGWLGGSGTSPSGFGFIFFLKTPSIFWMVCLLVCFSVY